MKGAKQKLKGKNQIKKFRQIAEQLASEISALKDVVGIVFIGGLVRGFVDKSSDIDIIVFTNKRDTQLRRQIRSLGNAVEKQFNIDLDLEIHFLEDFKKQPWDEIDKWEFSKARIVFDPKRKIKKTFKEKLKVPKEFWIRRIAVCSEYLKWYCCPPKEGVGTVAQSWIDRGDLISAHYSLNYATDLLVRLTFALNRDFTPAPKWRIYYLRNLKWQPKGYKEHLKEALSLKSFSAKDFDRRLRAIRTTWHEILPKIKQETGFTPQLMTKYYVEKILHQTGALNKLGTTQILEQIDL
jgi:predicted nucleotidyltransferase